MNSKRKGNIAEAKVLSRFVELEIPVLIPFGDNERYDFVVELEEGFKRIQCKTGRFRNGCVLFNAYSSYAHRGKGKKDYIGEIDYFGVYCDYTNSVYLVPVLEVGSSEVSLRVKPTLNKQVKRINLACNYIL